MKILVEVTGLLSEAEIMSELRHTAGLDLGYTNLGDVEVKILGTVEEIRQSDGYGGIRKAYHLEEL